MISWAAQPQRGRRESGSRYCVRLDCSRLLRLPVSAKFNHMASIIGEVGATFSTLVKGFSVTLKTMFRKPTTEIYPDGPVQFQSRYRGIHVLHRDENGLEKCVGCFLCAAACPANCIYIEAAENTAANRISAGERYARVYNIDYSRCIFCGYCVESCPTDAITHGHDFQLAPYNINELIYRKEQLVEKGSLKNLQAQNSPAPAASRY
jgi:NADH-quinone oxidoreductase subunit I